MTKNIIFLHGLLSSSKAYKASVIRQSFPELIVPNFTGSLWERMDTLYPIMDDKTDWTIIGSSFGGLMGAIFTCEHPNQVRKLIMLAPALTLPEFASFPSREPVTVPTTIIHGTQDDVIPLEEVCQIAEKVFPNLTHHVVEDDHQLHIAADTLDWKEILV